jgi:hypothetical protein
MEVHARAHAVVGDALRLFLISMIAACAPNFDKFKRVADAGHTTRRDEGKDATTSAYGRNDATSSEAVDAGAPLLKGMDGGRSPSPDAGNSSPSADAGASGDAGADAACKGSSCGCEPGYVLRSNGCQDIDECASNNGGCADHVTCANTPGSFQCGDCAPGYIGGGLQGCTPVLSDLDVSPGTMAPTFDPAVKQYDVSVALITSTISLTAAVPEGASLTINGAHASSGVAWKSSPVPIGQSSIDLTVSADSGLSSSYTLAITRGKQEAYIKASNAEAGDWFGFCVALSGNTLLVGAPHEDSAATMVNGAQSDNSATDVGAAYVFERVDGSWVQQAYLKSKYGAEPYRATLFGNSVAIDGDIAVVLAGGDSGYAHGVNQTPTFPASGQDQAPRVDGAAFVFERSSRSQWTPTAYLKPCDDAGSQMSPVAIAGATIVMGYPTESSSAQGASNANTCAPSNGNAANSGAVYIFVRTAGGWVQQAYLKASDSVAGLQFGAHVAISGDTLAVAAPGNGGLPGLVYMFTRAGGIWQERAKLMAPDQGKGLNLEPALNGNTLIETARTPLVGASGPKQIYVFTGSNDSWVEEASFAQVLPGIYALHAVVLAQDAFLVGVSGESSGGAGIETAPASTTIASSGATYLFTREQGVWSKRALIKASNPDANDLFGTSLALSGDTLVVSAIGEASAAKGINGGAAAEADNSAMNAGAVYVFR